MPTGPQLGVLGPLCQSADGDRARPRRRALPARAAAGPKQGRECLRRECLGGVSRMKLARRMGPLAFPQNIGGKKTCNGKMAITL